MDELNGLALRATRVHPIASRCGVFCKTDIQNLIAKNIPKEDIAASIFHAVTVQTIVTLAHGCDIVAPILLCGGPLTFIPALRKSFANYLQLSEENDFLLPEKSNLIPAWGAALTENSRKIYQKRHTSHKTAFHLFLRMKRNICNGRTGWHNMMCSGRN